MQKWEFELEIHLKKSNWYSLEPIHAGNLFSVWWDVSPRRHDERSRPSDGRHPAGQKGCIDVNDVTEVDCARSVIYTNKTKLHRNQHAFFFNMILFAIHITLNKSRNPNEGHGWRGALSTTQKIARGHWFRENLPPKLEKKSRQGWPATMPGLKTGWHN